MIKIEIDGDNIKEITVGESKRKIVTDFITAFYATFGVMANDAEEYNAFRDIVVKGIMLADYDELKENVFENE